MALPTGDLRATVYEHARRAPASTAESYEPGSRLLRTVEERHRVTCFVSSASVTSPFRLRWATIDLGICSDVWFTELQIKLSRSNVSSESASLPGPRTERSGCAPQPPESGAAPGESPLRQGPRRRSFRMPSELPEPRRPCCNPPSHSALHRVIPLFGSADAYPPEDADLVVMARLHASGERWPRRGSYRCTGLFSGGVALVANARRAVGSSNCGPLLDKLGPLLDGWRSLHFEPAER